MALTPVQAVAAAYIGGFIGDNVPKAAQLAMTVSGLDPAKVANDHYGLWQIKKSAHPDLFQKYKWNNPADNARMANVLFQKRAGLLSPNGSWSRKDWQVIGNTTYKSHEKVCAAAWVEFKKRVANGASPEKILGAKRSDGQTSVEGGIASGPVNDAVGADDPAANSTGDSISSYVNQALGQFYKMGINTAVLIGAGLLIVLGIVILLRQPLTKAASTAAKVVA